MNPGIASVIKSKAWQDIIQIFQKEMDLNLANIATNQTDREIATQYVGKIEAQAIINKALMKIDKEGNETVIPPRQSMK